MPTDHANTRVPTHTGLRICRESFTTRVGKLTLASQYAKITDDGPAHWSPHIATGTSVASTIQQLDRFLDQGFGCPSGGSLVVWTNPH
jgi:hypothetical protein